MELDFSKNTYFFPKNQKTNFLQEMHFWLKTAPSFEKKTNYFQKNYFDTFFYKYQNRHPVKIPFKSIKKWCTFAILKMITCWNEKNRFEVFIIAKVTWRGLQTNVFFLYLLFCVEFGIFTFSTWKHTYQRGIWARKMKMVKNHQLGHFLVQTFP